MFVLGLDSKPTSTQVNVLGWKNAIDAANYRARITGIRQRVTILDGDGGSTIVGLVWFDVRDRM